MNKTDKKNFIIITIILIALFMSLPFLTNIIELTGLVIYDDVIDDAVLEELKKHGEVKVIIEYKDRVSEVQKVGIKQETGFSISSASAGILEDDDLGMLRSNRNVVRVSLDVLVSKQLNDSLPVIEASNVWSVFTDQNITGNGMTACVIDTGVNYLHPVFGCTGLNEGENCSVIGGIDYFNNDDDPMDDDGHGTHVAHTILSVAPNANILAVKALDDQGNGLLSDVIKGIEYCIDKKEEYNVSVISLSLGTAVTFENTCDSYNTVGTAAINEAVNSGLVVVSATGNANNYQRISFPSCVNKSFRVTATNNNDVFASFANRGPGFPDIITAPGVGIRAAVLEEGYSTKSGTSMSTPFVSGAVILLQQYNNQSASDVLKTLQESGRDLYDEESSSIIPRINVFSAIKHLDNKPPIIELENINNTVYWNIFDDVGIKNYSVELKLFDNITFFNETQGNITLKEYGVYFFNLSAVDYSNNTASENFSFSLKEMSYINLTLNKENLFYGESLIITVNATHNATLYINNEDFMYGKNFSLVYEPEIGEYNISAEIESTNTTFSYYTNVEVVVNKSNPLVNEEPSSGNITILENETIIFTHNSTDPRGLNLTTYWILNNETYENETYELGKINQTKNLTLVVSNNHTNTTKNWFIKVERLEPLIKSYEPEQDFEIRKNHNFTLVINASDWFNRTLYYNWSSNSTNNTYYLITSNYEEGEHNITVNISNDYKSIKHTWNVNVKPIYTPVIFNGTIPDYELEQGEKINLELNNYFTYYEDINYELINGTGLILEGEELSSNNVGTWNVTIFATDNETNETSNNFIVKINEKTIEPTRTTTTSSGGGSPPPIPSPATEEETKETTTTTTIQTNTVQNIKTSRTTSITIEEITEPIDIIQNINDTKKIYKVLQIKTEEPTQANISFKTSKEWHEQEQVSINQTKLYKYEQEQWTQLKTRHTKKDETHNYFEAEIPSFSYFIIGSEKEPTITPQLQEPRLIIQEPQQKTFNPLIILLLTTTLLLLYFIKKELYK